MKWKITISVLLVVLIVGSGIGIYLLNQRNVNELVKKGERINLLVLGLDHIEGAQARRSDTMMLVSIDTANDKASLISIPRDLFLKYPDGNFRRVNAAYDQRTKTGNQDGLKFPRPTDQFPFGS